MFAYIVITVIAHESSTIEGVYDNAFSAEDHRRWLVENSPLTEHEDASFEVKETEVKSDFFFPDEPATDPWEPGMPL